MTEQQMLLRVGYKAAYRKEMSWVVGTIAALEGDRALLDLEPTPSLPVALDSRIRIALSDRFSPFWGGGRENIPGGQHGLGGVF